MNVNKVHSEKNCILIVEDDRINRQILRRIFSPKYEYEEAGNGFDGLQKIEEHIDKICAILLDVAMPVMDGIELLRILYARGITKMIPVFLITANTESEVVEEAYKLGVMDVITKPATPFVIARRVENLIELFRSRESLLHRNTIEALASAIEFRDVESGEHTNRIYSITKYILTNTEFGDNLSEADIEDIAVASIMHDVGKIAISDVILNKPGKLTADEFEVMKTHATKGEKLVTQISKNQSHASYEYASDIARHHHERWDGGGYPDGLKGDEISVWAQVVSIADVYDALVSPRVYKKAFSPDEAVRMIANGECGVFNPRLLQSFLAVEPEMRQWYAEEEEALDEKCGDNQDTKKCVCATKSGGETQAGSVNREVIDVLLLMTAIQSVYDMIICVNLTKNSYYMIDYDRFLTHVAGYDGVFDDLIVAGASAVPESHRELFTQTFGRESLLRAYRSGKKSVILEHPQWADDGTEHMVSTSVLFLEEPKTGDVLEITLSRYIDDEWQEKEKNRQILSDALIVAEQANNAKADFLSQMSHDIRTPLNAIIGMATIIGANVSDAEKVRECVEKIGVSSKYLLNLINDILVFSKIESGALSINAENFDIRNMAEDIHDIVEERAVEKNQILEVSVDKDVRDCYKGDAFRIRQILINLLDNAYKYTPEGGKYSLQIKLSKRTVNHHFIMFVVEDNGTGISESCIEKIFSPFVQCSDVHDQNGVGLGLAITRNLVHLMNGKLDVESVVGEGTKFTVEIPLEISAMQVPSHKEEKASATDLSATEQVIYSGEKILVAEDNELNQEIIKTILEMDNLQVEIVPNGKEAVERFTGSEPGEYLVIFMDVSMPVMNGYEATRLIRRSSHKEATTIPIYALTANAFHTDVMEAKNSGMDGHIAKPVDFEEVSKILNQIIVAKKGNE